MEEVKITLIRERDKYDHMVWTYTIEGNNIRTFDATKSFSWKTAERAWKHAVISCENLDIALE